MTTENTGQTPPPDPEEQPPAGEETPPKPPGELEPLPEDEAVPPHVLKERNRELAQLRAENRKLAEENEKARQASLSEQEKALEQARQEGFADAEGQYKTKLLASRVRALASGEFNDPDDVIHFIDTSEIDPDITDVDLSDILRELLEAKPYLALNKREPTKPIPQGPRGNEAQEDQGDWLRKVATGRG